MASVARRRTRTSSTSPRTPDDSEALRVRELERLGRVSTTCDSPSFESDACVAGASSTSCGCRSCRSPSPSARSRRARAPWRACRRSPSCLVSGFSENDWYTSRSLAALGAAVVVGRHRGLPSASLALVGRRVLIVLHRVRRPHARGRMGARWSSSPCSSRWRGCSGRSRAPRSSPGRTAATSCTEGSGNPGASNVARLLGWRAGAARARCSTSPRARSRPGVGLAVGGRPGAFVLGVAAVVGHTFPLYRKGGKGVAAAGGDARRALPVDRASGSAVVWFVVARRAAQGVARVAAHDDRCSRLPCCVRGLRRCGRSRVLAALAVLVDRCVTSANIRRLLRRQEIDLGTSADSPRIGVARSADATSAQGGDPGRRARHAVPARDEEPPQGDAAGRRQARDPVRRRRSGAAPGSPTSSSSPAAASARSKTTSTATSSSSTTSNAGKHDLLKEVQFASDLADIHYVRQRDPLGLGHAVSVGASARRRRAVRGAARRRHHGRRRACCSVRCSTAYEQHGTSVVALLEVRPRRSRRTAASSPTASDGRRRRRDPRASSRSRRARRAVEPRGDRPLRVHARDLRRARPHRAGRGRRAPAHRRDRAAARRSSPCSARCCTCGRYDVGQKLDFLRANIELALDRADLGPQLRERCAERVHRRGSGAWLVVISLEDAQQRDPRRGRTAGAARGSRCADARGLVLAAARVAVGAGAAVREHRDGRLRGARGRHRGASDGAGIARRRRARRRARADDRGRRRARRSAS